MRILIISLLLITGVFVDAQTQLAYNKGFEVTKTRGSRWKFFDIDSTYSIEYAAAVKRSGNHSLFMNGKNAERTPDDADAAFTLVAVLPEIWKGKKKIRVEAWVKTDSAKTHAAIWFSQYIKQGAPIVLNESHADSTKQHKDWQHLKIEMPVNDSAYMVEFGALLNGRGKAWFDDFALYVDDKLITDVATTFTDPSVAEKAWLNKNAVELLTIEPGKSNQDLDSVAAWIKNARLVGAGEGTHGTYEFGVFKLRLFRYLVEAKGFNVFMLEDNLPECEMINEYVLGKNDGGLKPLIKNLFKVGRTEEMISVIEWMRTYNSQHKSKIWFAGMDMQSVVFAIPNLRKFALQYDKTLLPMVDSLAVYSTGLTESFLDTSGRDSKWPFIVKILSDISSHVANNATNYLAVPSDTLNSLNANLAVLKQFFPQHYSVRSSPYRDSCMAQNVKHFSTNYPGSKMMIWAHNGHISKSESAGSKALGGWLKTLFAEDYFNIALTTANGKYSATANPNVAIKKRVYGQFLLEAPYPGTAEYYFERSNKKNFALLLNGISIQKNKRIGPAAAWLSRDIGLRGLGAAKMDQQFFELTLPDHFDAIVFIRNSNASHLLDLE